MSITYFMNTASLHELPTSQFCLQSTFFQNLRWKDTIVDLLKYYQRHLRFSLPSIPYLH